MAGKKKSAPDRYAVRNRKARHNYHIEETVEAGIVLTGTEVKSLREGRANISDAYATEKDGAIYLLNAHISEYEGGNRFNHAPLRPRLLLLHRREIGRLLGAVQRKGMTLVPLSIYFNDRGYAKVELGLARGKQAHDKRASIKEREWKRDKARLVRGRGEV